MYALPVLLIVSFIVPFIIPKDLTSFRLVLDQKDLCVSHHPPSRASFSSCPVISNAPAYQMTRVEQTLKSSPQYVILSTQNTGMTMQVGCLTPPSTLPAISHDKKMMAALMHCAKLVGQLQLNKVHNQSQIF